MFFIPLYLAKIKIGFFSTNVLEIIISATFLVWFFSDKGKINFQDFFQRYKKYIIAGGLMLIGIFLSTFFNGNHLESWGIIKGWFLFPLIFLFLVGIIIPKEKIDHIFWAYFFSGATVALISMGYLILGHLTYDGRLIGFFNSPNYLAMYLAPAIIISLFQIQNRNLKLKNLLIFLSIIILIAFYFTYSYGAWIAVLGALLIIALIKKSISLKNIIIAILIIIVLFFSQINNKKLTDLLTANPRSSLSSRIMIWKASGKMIENNFWIGIGPGNFQNTYLKYQKFYPPYLEWAVPHPNNLYLTFWLYSGISGLIGFLVLTFFWFKKIFEKIKTEPSEILFMALGIMLVILIHGIFDTTYFKNDLAIVFWLNFLALKK